MIPKETYPGGDNFGARLGIDFTKDEVIAYLTKRGYIIKKVSGPSKQYYGDNGASQDIFAKTTIAYQEGDSIPERMDDDIIIYQMSLQSVFLYELKKKLLEI